MDNGRPRFITKVLGLSEDYMYYEWSTVYVSRMNEVSSSSKDVLEVSWRVVYTISELLWPQQEVSTGIYEL